MSRIKYSLALQNTLKFCVGFLNVFDSTLVQVQIYIDLKKVILERTNDFTNTNECNSGKKDICSLTFNIFM